MVAKIVNKVLDHLYMYTDLLLKMPLWDWDCVFICFSRSAQQPRIFVAYNKDTKNLNFCS
jgi:hypothetical protein